MTNREKIEDLRREAEDAERDSRLRQRLAREMRQICKRRAFPRERPDEAWNMWQESAKQFNEQHAACA